MSKNLAVSDFMSTQITSVNTNDSLLFIAESMQAKNISCVMVLEDDLPVGIVTERNIVHYLATHRADAVEDMIASALMPSTLVTINQDDSLFEAMVLCRSQRIKHLAVVDNDAHLVGIITHSDLIDANFAQIEQQAALLGAAVDGGSEDINARLLEMTLTDPLMEIGNRRSMEIDLKQSHELSVRYSRPYSVALIDVDFFKKYNDFYGHMAGDEALKATADCLKLAIRNVDRLYRYGGEELLLLMPETPSDAALAVAHRLVSGIADLKLIHDESPIGHLTISVGVSAFDFGDTPDQSLDQLIDRADKALYQAKQSGRNQALMLDDGTAVDGLIAVG